MILIVSFSDTDSLSSVIWLSSQSQRVRVRITLRLAVYGQSVRLNAKPHQTHGQHFFFQLNPCGHSPYATSPLTRGWVCRLQLLLALASAVILRSESRRTYGHILLSQIRDSTTWRARPKYLYPPGTGWPSYTPRHWVPFPSPPTTGRATVEVFGPASTREWLLIWMMSSSYSLGTDSIENTASKNSSIVACLFVAAETCLKSRY
jgi:hypothetical protein